MDRRAMLIMGLALATVTAFAAPTYAAADMAAEVQAAKTPADHEALAKKYDADAATATQNAAMHRKMGEAYKGMPATSGGKAGGASAMPGHCDSLAKNFDAEATHYKEMAQTHRDLAKTAQ